MLLERPGQKPVRISTKILVQASSKAQTTENRRLAEAAYDALMGDLARQRFKLPSTAPPRTFHQQATWYLQHKTPTHRGADRERRRIAQLAFHFAYTALEDISPTRWTEYAAKRLTKDGVSVNTVGNELTVMKAILTSAVPEWLEANPLATVKRKKDKLPAKRTIARDEEPAFLRALARADREIHDMYLVGVGTLLRQENLLTLRRRDHRGDRLALITKTGPHQIPLTGPTPLQRRAATVLKKRMPRVSDGYFFPVWQDHFAQFADQGHARVQFLRIVRRAAEAAGLPWGIRQGGIVWHTATRATGATRMLRDYKVDVRTVQMVGGWTSLDQMMEYLGLDRGVFRT